MTKKPTTAKWLPLGAFAAFVLIAASVPTPADAFLFDNRPDRAYCFNSPGDYGIGKKCDYDTYAQCLATARGISGTCEVNPWYAADAYAPRPAPRRAYRTY